MTAFAYRAILAHSLFSATAASRFSTGLPIRQRKPRRLTLPLLHGVEQRPVVSRPNASITQAATPEEKALNIQSSPSSLSVLKEILQGVRQLAVPLWNGDKKWMASLWTTATIALALLATLYAVLLSMIQKFFWNCLSAKDTAKFGKLLIFYCLTVAIGPVVIALFEWVKQRLALMWRKSLTEHLMSQYFADLNYYKLSLDGSVIDNPDQRISEDVMKFTSRAVRFFTIIGVGVFDLVVFSVILYRVYSPLLFALILYAAIGTVLIAYAGHRLLHLNRVQVTREADFRFGLVRVRETTEGIAFYNGARAEMRELLQRFTTAFQNNVSLVGLKRNVDYFSSSFRYWVQVVPTVVIAPQYFAGNFPLGTLSQVYFSFNHVLSSLGLVVSEFSALAEFGAGVRRLKDLADRLSSGNILLEENKILTDVIGSDGPSIVKFNSVSVRTPSNSSVRLVRNLTMKISAGEKLLIVGRSGIGKSSLLRVLCGLWDYGEGHITRPSQAVTLFLPQKPFIMLGTLRENVMYPRKGEEGTTPEVEMAMRRVNLGHLLGEGGKLDTLGETLSRRLSLGEQQRLAFARILISKPRLVVLDESTSALDLGNERDMYQIISDLGVTCISVGNRPSLAQFHDKILRLGAEGSWDVASLETSQEAQERKDGDLTHPNNTT